MSRLRLNKIATPATPAASKGEVFYSSSLSPAALAAIDESGNIARIAGFTTKDYRLVKRLYLYNGTTTYTPTSGVTALHIEGIGSGAAGGGAAAGTAGTNNAAGGGGGGGGGARVWLTTAVAAACVVAIGLGGLVGTTGNNPGGNGNPTTFTDTGSTLRLQANGGTGGGGSAVGTTAINRGAGGAGGTASGTPAEGATGTTWQGEDGDPGIANGIVATGMMSGKGGGSQYGSGGAGVVGTSGAGNAGRKYGGGGSGGADSAAATRQGGAGANGIMVIEEWA